MIDTANKFPPGRARLDTIPANGTVAREGFGQVDYDPDRDRSPGDAVLDSLVADGLLRETTPSPDQAARFDHWNKPKQHGICYCGPCKAERVSLVDRAYLAQTEAERARHSAAADRFSDAEDNRVYDLHDLIANFDTALRRVRGIIGYAQDDRAERIALEIAKATAGRA